MTNVFEQAKQEAATREFKKKMPARLWVKKGESRTVIVLDKNIESLYRHHEHSINGPGGDWKNAVIVVSPRTIGEFDPLENSIVYGNKVGSPRFVIFATVLDLSPWKNKEGKEFKYSRRLLPILSNSLDAFESVFEAVEDEEGTIRGLALKLSRGTQDKSASIGHPSPAKGTQYKLVPEAELIKKYGHDSIKNKDGKVVIPKNGLLKPIDYEKAMPVLSEEELRRMFGLGAPIGSSADLDSDNVFDDIDEADEVINSALEDDEDDCDITD